jgi:hypothetical protein
MDERDLMDRQIQRSMNCLLILTAISITLLIVAFLAFRVWFG